MRLVLAAMVVAVLAACGSPPCSQSCAGLASPHTPHLDRAFDVLVTVQDRAVSAHIGEKIELYLVPPQHMTPWENLRVDDTTVLAPVHMDVVPPQDVATVAGFLAAKAGVANVTAYASPQCAPNEACPAYAMLFEVRVTVT